MRNSAIVQWLNTLRSRSTPKPRRAMLGLNAFESRDMPSAALAASAVVDVAHARTCGDDNHGSKVSAVAKTIGGNVKDCHTQPPVCTPCDNGSHGKGSNNKGSGGKGSGGKCDNGSKGSNNKGSGGKCDNGSTGKGSNNKGSSGKGSGGKCDNGSSGKGSNNKGSSGKGSNCKVVPPACEVPPPCPVPPPPSCEVPPPPCPVPPPTCDDTPKQKGNNGVGNGLDPQPPGNPRINDGPGTSPGSPGNKGKK